MTVAKIISPNFKKLENLWATRQAHYLAPMAGLTNEPFRRLMKKLGAPITVSELVSATGLLYGSQKTLDLAGVNPEEHALGPVAIQLFGDEAPTVVKACEILAQQDFGKYIDFIDINMGCPVPKVTKKGGGSALLRDLVYLREFLSEVVAGSPYPITIKIRTGWDENEKTGPQVAQVAEAAGVKAIAVHGRTRAQGYAGVADWDLIARIAAETHLPVMGNGDILSAEQALSQMKQHPRLAGVMIGRGSLKDPWIFTRLRQLQTDETFEPLTWNFADVVQTLHDYLEGYGTPHFRDIQLKKFAAWFSHGLEGAAQFRKQVFATEQTSEIIGLSKEFFAGINSRDADSKNFTPILMGGHG